MNKEHNMIKLQFIAAAAQNAVQAAIQTAANAAAPEPSTEVDTMMEELDKIENVDQLMDWIGKGINSFVKSAISWAFRLVIAILFFLLARFILKKVVKFVSKKLDKRNVPDSLKGIVLWLLNYGVTIYLVVSILVFLDLLKSATVAAAIAAIGVGVSLALQGAIKNFAGGLLLLLLKPFREGDYISVDSSKGIEGTVEKIHVYYTTLLNVYNDRIRVPNSELTDKSVKNMMADSNKRVEIHVSIGYDEDIEKSLSVLQEVVQSDPRIYEDRQAYFVHELGPHSVVLGLRCVCRREDYLAVYWDLNKKIRLRFAEEDITIPFEQLDVHIKEDHVGKIMSKEG